MKRQRALLAINEARPTGAPLGAQVLLERHLRQRYATTAVMKLDGPLRTTFSRLADEGIVQPGGTIYTWLTRLRFRGIAVGGARDRRVAERVLEDANASLVIADTVVCLDFAMAAGRSGLPSLLFVHEHEPVLGVFLRTFRASEPPAGTTVVANSEATAAAVREHWGPEAVGAVIHSPVDVRALARARGRPFPTPLVVGAGRVIDRKGVDIFLDVADIVRRHLPQVRFCWFGDGPALGTLRRRARRRDLSDAVEFPGAVTESTRIYRGAWTCLVPSRVEPLSRVAIESMAAGVPVVATDVPGLADVVDGAGILTSVDPEALADGVLDVLSDERLRTAMSEKGEKRARDHFGLEAWDDAVAELLDGLEARTP